MRLTYTIDVVLKTKGIVLRCLQTAGVPGEPEPLCHVDHPLHAYAKIEYVKHVRILNKKSELNS